MTEEEKKTSARAILFILEHAHELYHDDDGIVQIGVTLSNLIDEPLYEQLQKMAK